MIRKTAMIREMVSIAALAALLAAPAFAQSPEGGPRIPNVPGAMPAQGGQQAPSGPDAAGTPGPDSEIIGPDGSFRLKPDGVDWERFQTARAIGVRCSEKSCGGDRVLCMIQVRNAEAVKPGQPISGESAAEFGSGVLKNAPKELKADYVAPFAEKSFGPNSGQWAEVKAEGEPGSLRFGLFLTSAEKRLVAFNCVSPTAKWDENKPKFEKMLASLKITK